MTTHIALRFTKCLRCGLVDQREGFEGPPDWAYLLVSQDGKEGYHGSLCPSCTGEFKAFIRQGADKAEAS